MGEANRKFDMVVQKVVGKIPGQIYVNEVHDGVKAELGYNITTKKIINSLRRIGREVENYDRE